MATDVIIALDFASKEEVYGFLALFGDRKPFVKIGMELFYSEGPAIVREIKRRGHKVFLDLKLHDIPNTVMKAMRVLSDLDVDMCNLHAGGGSEMMKAAVKGLTATDGSRPLLLAVTQLTSTDEKMLKDEILVSKSMQDTILSYALNAKMSGLDGVVCSPLEAEKVHAVCGKEFLTVTPGVRFPDGEKADQKRVMTPEQARKIGSDFIVVGRPVTRADNPVEAYERCIKEFLG